MKKIIAVAILISGMAFGQSFLPDGTKLRVRLEESLSSAQAAKGQAVELTVTEDVSVRDRVFIPKGARAMGKIVHIKRAGRMGRSGKLDFSIEAVQAVDGKRIPVRYSPVSADRKRWGIATGVLAAKIGLAFLPAAPLALLHRGDDVSIASGTTFDVFTDAPYSPSAAGMSPDASQQPR